MVTAVDSAVGIIIAFVAAFAGLDGEGGLTLPFQGDDSHGHAHRASPAVCGALLDRCAMLVAQQEFARSRTCLETALQSPAPLTTAERARAHFLLAISYHGEGRTHAALGACKKAVDNAPQEASYRRYLGICLYNLGRLREAEAILSSHLKAYPDDASVLFVLGLVAIEEDDVDTAHSHLARAIDVASDSQEESRARMWFAEVLRRQGDLQGARDQLVESLRRAPGNLPAYYRLASVLRRLGDHEGAGRVRQAIETLKSSQERATAKADEGP